MKGERLAKQNARTDVKAGKMPQILSHESEYYQTPRQMNGAYLYSQEIVKYFIPNIKTDRNWVTIRAVPHCFNHSIVFIHNNLNAWFYDYLANYDDLILVCGVPSTCDMVKHLGTPIYLPLSVPVEEIKKYRVSKTKHSAYAGREGKFASCNVPLSIPHLSNLTHDELLSEIAKYQNIYAVGRTAIEAKVLGCHIKAYDPRFPDPDVWKIVDTFDAIKILQEKLDEIDGVV